ncbi:MAG: hypothetical protein JWR08_962 [Enterovirga sp.]|jgi:hypothetical protein|nr:hypothetical protein [Enterovirga sp.]
MAHIPDNMAGNTIPEFELRDDDRFTAYDDDGHERSSFVAFLMGGVVVAGGLFAFLLYDTDALNGQPGRDVLATGSINRLDSPATATVPSIRLAPAAPERASAP